MIHKTSIENINSFEELVEEIGNLRYDKLAEFLSLLSNKIHEDGNNDFNKNRIKLAQYLRLTGNNIYDAALAIDEAWEICKNKI
jgi:hypothetical protein